ncbi:MAG: DNA gyrase/topoisomerase IV subunit A [Flavobacteriales bacterium]|nr:DNA gyrase/topoisomerase IV subunit A [Flavobacteriales bacterium]
MSEEAQGPEERDEQEGQKPKGQEEGAQGADRAEDSGDSADQAEGAGDESTEDMEQVIRIKGMYNEYFLDYASYVILERAVPHLHDGLKPVQRRILHSLRELEDGRFHKVANAIGNTMKYHPHGDASIGDAMVQIGQRELVLDCQGNWGNILTGDRAAAPRYIETRLSTFAKDALFNPKTTNWLSSYDGRNQEPETLPVKFPLLLQQGAEGIAVGLACKMLPHNFIELIDGAVAYLKGRSFKLLPDFPTGGEADCEQYNDGLRGGRIRVRAKIRKEDNKTLIVEELPYGVTTTSLIESILKANDKGKIKVKRVEDNTAEFVEVMIHLASGVSPDRTIDALFAFTDCEVRIAPNACVIEDDRPIFLGVKEILKRSADRTRMLLGRELEIRLGELQEAWHFASLEKIFIEKRIYRDIEECETWEAILQAIHEGLAPHIKHLIRPVTDEDVTRLTEIRIKRISKFDSDKADQRIANLEVEMDEVKNHLEHLTDYTVEWYRQLKKKYGKGRERKTVLRTFGNIDSAKVAVANHKLYADKDEGFVGIGMPRGEGEYICDCSDIADIIVFRKDGTMQVSKVSPKAFFGKDILQVGVWKRGDERTTYNLLYRDGKKSGGGRTYVKRFHVTSITRDKVYHLTKGTPGSQVLWFSANANGEAEEVTIHLSRIGRLKTLKVDVNFAEIAIKGRGAAGNTATKYAVTGKVDLKSAGTSTLGARRVWFDEAVKRLNSEGRGRLIGAFGPEDRLLVVLASGAYELMKPELSTHFPDDMVFLDKWHSDRPLTVVHKDGEKSAIYVKRFNAESSSKTMEFIGESEGSSMLLFTDHGAPVIKCKSKDLGEQRFSLNEFIAVKGVKARGKRLSTDPRAKVTLEDTPNPNDEVKEARDAAPGPIAPAPSSEQASEPKGASPEATAPDSSESAATPKAPSSQESNGPAGTDSGGDAQPTLF